MYIIDDFKVCFIVSKIISKNMYTVFEIFVLQM